MPLELGLLSEGLCYLRLSRVYSLQSYLCPAPVWLCAHTSAPSLGGSEEPLVTIVWVQVITRPWLLPCTRSESFSLLTRRNCPLSCVLLGKHLSRGCAGARVAGCWQHSGSTVRCVLGTGVLTPSCFGKNNCREDSWGVSCQSYIRELSYSFLTAFLSL